MMQEEKLKLAVHPAAGVFRNWITRISIRRITLATCHYVYEWAPLSIISRKPRSHLRCILLHACTVIAGAVDHPTQMRVLGEWKPFEGSVPSAKGITIHHIHIVAVGHSNIHVPALNQLRFGNGCEQH